MFLTYLMLAVALCLSTIAAFYSIIGLTAIFAAAVVPVAVMGSILEIAKLVVTVWLHEYWRQCRLAMKAYLVPAVGVLMLITSMGIFGFLSKAHLDQAVPAGDISAQVAIFDEKIKTQRDNIEAARTALKQMDAQVDQVLGRTTDDRGAERAVQIRRQQAAERNRLQQDISRSQAEIVKLNEQRAPIAAQARKVEAEVGPIKYIAALIYGDNPDTNLLEKAVRWVIIILVIVFDPLAIFMLLAATESYKWEKHQRRRDQEEQADPPDQPVNDAITKTKIWAEDLWQKLRSPQNGIIPDDATVPKDLDGHSARTDLGDQPLAAMVGQPTNIPADQWGGQDLTQIIKGNQPAIVSQDPAKVDPDESQDTDNKAAQRRWKSDNPDKTLKEQRHLLAMGEIDKLPWEESPRTDIRSSESGFGTNFPDNPEKGQLWIRTDNLPTTLHKFNGEKWIEVVKDQSDSYAFNEEYINHLIAKIGSGEYDPELLTDAERLQIESRLRTDTA